MHGDSYGVRFDLLFTVRGAEARYDANTDAVI